MAQLRLDYEKFKDRQAEVVVVGPEGPLEFKDYWEEKDLPFVGLPDPRYKVLKRYHQEVNLLKLGRMPAQFVIDQNGILRYANYGTSMQDIPSNREILKLLDDLNREQSKDDNQIAAKV